MHYLSSGSEEDFSRNLVSGEQLVFPDANRQPNRPMNGAEEGHHPIQIGLLLRKYWLLILGLTAASLAAGFVSVVLSAPLYQSRVLLEVQNSSGMLANDGRSGETSEVDIQTQVNILRSGSFLRRGAERMTSEEVLPTPDGTDIFARLRQRIHPANQNPIEVAKTGLQVAVATFNARPINQTRLIELTSESTSPEVAAQFLNSMANEFMENSRQSRVTTAQKTSEWLAQQIEETKSRVADAEEHLQAFVQASGNIFAGEVTLDDTKLAQLKGELAKTEAERIAKQTRYEQTMKNPPEQLGEILDDGVLRGYKMHIEELKREKAVLLLTLTEKNEKVRKVDAQLSMLQKTYENEVNNAIKRVKHDYDAVLQHEKLLTHDYAGQSQRVGSEAGKAAQYNAFKREVDTQRQMYASLLMQQNQANLSSSVPVSPIRVVEAAAPAASPYKPKPVLNICFGGMLGLALAGGLIFLRERLDSSIKAPGMSRGLFNVPELGVIPNLGIGDGAPRGNASVVESLNGNHVHSAKALATTGVPGIITESFRNTLASIIRSQASGVHQKIILVTSPGPSEGKTTVVQNLGMVLAESGRRVLLIDADFRRPNLHRKFGLPNQWGLIDLLCEDTPLHEYESKDTEIATGIPGLSIFPNRVTTNNVAKALYSTRFRALLDSLSKRFDMILLDAPPILSVADARIIAPLADSLILVLRCGVTDRQGAMEAYHRIQEDGVTLLGSILTDYDLRGDRRRQYYYDYGVASKL